MGYTGFAGFDPDNLFYDEGYEDGWEGNKINPDFENSNDYIKGWNAGTKDGDVWKNLNTISDYTYGENNVR